MDLKIFEDNNQLSTFTAEFIINYVKQNPKSVIVVPSGDSPKLTFQKIVELSDSSIFDDATIIGLDEWVGISPENEGSCGNFIRKFLVEPLNNRKLQTYFFNQLAENLELECEKMNQVIESKGGIDIMLVGIGLNGHIGLNEPKTDWNLYAHLSELAEMTITVGQKYFTESTDLKYGITLGLKHLQESKHPILIANGAIKAEIISDTINGTVSIENPSTIFQTIPHSHVWLDASAASMLK
ncbi:MAG: 6-phosphogluconolactonase [Spirosomaceae bacterium]|nr:6-phosphogluconolactonase [Spirosomataceae bacterium]